MKKRKTRTARALLPASERMLLTKQETAGILGISLRTLDSYISRSLIAFVRLGALETSTKPRVRFRRQDIEAFVASQLHPAA
jgi:hypothetical protein